jgi:hypothetical protein
MFDNDNIGIDYLKNRIHSTKERIQKATPTKECPAHRDVAEGLVTLLEVSEYQLKRYTGFHINWRMASMVSTVVLGVLIGFGYWVQGRITDVNTSIQPKIEQVRQVDAEQMLKIRADLDKLLSEKGQKK